MKIENNKLLLIYLKRATKLKKKTYSVTINGYNLFSINNNKSYKYNLLSPR